MKKEQGRRHKLEGDGGLNFERVPGTRSVAKIFKVLILFIDQILDVTVILATANQTSEGRCCGTVTLTSISAVALISSSQLIRESLLLPQVLEMFIRTHITHTARILCC